MDNQIDSRINLGLVVKGNLEDIKTLLKVINESLGKCKIVYDKFSDDELWIVSGKRGKPPQESGDSVGGGE